MINSIYLVIKDQVDEGYIFLFLLHQLYYMIVFQKTYVPCGIRFASDKKACVTREYNGE